MYSWFLINRVSEAIMGYLFTSAHPRKPSSLSFCLFFMMVQYIIYSNVRGRCFSIYLPSSQQSSYPLSRTIHKLPPPPGRTLLKQNLLTIVSFLLLSSVLPPNAVSGKGDRKGRPYHTTKWLTRPVYGRGDHVLDKSALYGGRPRMVVPVWLSWYAVTGMAASERENRWSY